MRNRIELNVGQWAAWAPGLVTREDWHAWARGEKSFGGADEKPACAFIKPMQRRRLSRLSRMALEAAEQCRPEGPRPFHVFCSRYGEYARTTDILSVMARDEPVSPAAFSQSVHNTSAGLFTIIHEDRTPSTTVAAGEATLEAGVTEAWTALKTGMCGEALVVYHDEPLPELYGDVAPLLPVPLAAALLLRLPEDAPRPGGSLRLSLESLPATAAASEHAALHPVLQLIRMLTGEADVARAGTPRLCWEWRRNAAA